MSRRRKTPSRKPKPKPQSQSRVPQLPLLVEADREIWRANIGLRGALAMHDYLERQERAAACSPAPGGGRR